MSKVAAVDGRILFDFPAKNIRALAVDRRRGVVWGYGEGALKAYGFDGSIRVNVDVSVFNSRGSGQTDTSEKDNDTGDDTEGSDAADGGTAHTALAADEVDGSTWLAYKKSLIKFSASGNPLVSLALPEHARSLAFDQTRRQLWVATMKAVGARDAGGVPILALPLDKSSIVEDIAVDAATGEVWVATKNYLRRYTASGIATRVVDLRKLAYLSDGGDSYLWAATDKQLFRVHETGSVLFEIAPFAARGALVALTADDAGGSAWLARDEWLRQLSPDSVVIAEHRYPKPIRALAAYADTIAPELSIAEPAEDSHLSTSAPTLELTFSDNGIGVDPDTLEFELDGQPLGISCESTATEARCAPDSALPEGLATVSVTVADFAGNRASPASVSFTVDTIPPEINLDSPLHGALTKNPETLFLGRLSEAAELSLNGQPVTIGLQHEFNHGPVALHEGANTFELVAQDSAGNTNTLNLTVTLDTMPPVVTPPPALTVEATAVLTPVALGAATAWDAHDGVLSPAPSEAGPFALGSHVIIWAVTDQAGNTGSAVQEVIVQDTTPPALTVPPDIAVESEGPIVVALGQATASDIFGPVTIENGAPSEFPVGETHVVWTATDANGNSASAVQSVVIAVPPSASVCGAQARPLPASGQWEIPQPVRTIDWREGWIRDVGVSPQGEGMLVWAEVRNDQAGQVVASRYVPGVGLSPPDTLPTQGLGGSVNKLVVDDDGVVTFVWWHVRRPDPRDWQSNDEEYLYALRWSPEGGWSAPVQIAYDSSGAIDHYEIVADAAGNVTVVWNAGSSLRRIYARRYVAGSGWEDTAQVLRSASRSSLLGPRVAAHPDGEVVVVWNYAAEGVYQYGRDVIEVVRFIPANGWGQVEAISTGFESDLHVEPRVAMGGNGVPVVAWRSNNNFDHPGRVTALRRDPQAGWSDPEVVVSSIGYAGALSLAMDRSGNGNLLWSEWDHIYGEWDMDSISLCNVRYGSERGWSEPETVVSGQSGRFADVAPAVMLNSAGDGFAWWLVDSGAPNGDRNSDFWASRYDAGVGWGAPQKINDEDICNTASCYISGSLLAVAGNGEAYGVWTHYGADGQYPMVSHFALAGADNLPPVADAGPDKNVYKGSILTLDGAGSNDPDGEIAAYAWHQTEGPAAELQGADTSTPTMVAPNVDLDTVLHFVLTVTDNDGATASDTVVVNVMIDDATAPSIEAPADKVVEATGTLTNVDLGEPVVTDDLDGAVSVTADPISPFPLGVHTVTWTATDSAGNTAQATQQATVQDTTAPQLEVPPAVVVESTEPVSLDIGQATATDLFLDTLTNDAPAEFPLGETTVTWTATDISGNSTSDTQLVTVNPPPPVRVTVTTPLAGANVSDGAVRVSGTVESPPNVGVTVNGRVAAIDRTVTPYAFHAVVPLVLGDNTITVTGTTQADATDSKELTVNMTGAGPAPYVVSADPGIGAPPLDVSFTVAKAAADSPAVYAIHVDFDGDGAVDQEIVDANFSNPSAPVFRPLNLTAPIVHSYTTPGVYPATVWVNNLSLVGSVFTEQGYRFDHPIEVIDYAGLDLLLKSVYAGMLDRLRAGDIDNAVTAITDSANDKYRAIFTALAPNLGTIVDNLGTVTNGRLHRSFAEYMVVRENDGQRRAYFIYFLFGADGIWRIDGM